MGAILLAAMTLGGCANLPTVSPNDHSAQTAIDENTDQSASADDRLYGFGDGLLNKRLPSNPLAAINGQNAPHSAGTEAVFQAMAQLGVAYQRGGSSVGTGFDCSGLTSYAYKQADITLPRTAREQYAFTQRISKAQLKPGDLLFFKIRSRKIDHVGIYVGDNRFIHAPRVGQRIEYANLDAAYWKRHYVGAGRVPGASKLDLSEISPSQR
ncbi:C40 family peptidase [Halothiobacillus sp. DCM-1]|uniref:C40 family peptidase n=1 Tax=Halothiobacillus sp. DCM-1 TaxID=3112558 RepID=UPI003254751E